MIDRPPYLSERLLASSLSVLYERSRNAIFSLLFPFSCPGCSELVRYPDALCDLCATRLKKIGDPFCEKCGTPFPPHWRIQLCELCSSRKSAITRARSVYSYEGLVRQMIRAAKYRGQARYLRFFAEQLFLAAHSFPRVSAIVAVPLHRKREWRRRYNQAAILAAECSRLSGVPLWNGIIKSKATISQSALSGLARRNNLKGSFTCVDDAEAPRSILLIDDVITTSATMEECARTLRRAGAKRVYGLSVARALKHF